MLQTDIKSFFKVLEPPCTKFICWISPIQCNLSQSYEIKSSPWTILWFRILWIFSVVNIKRLCVFMFQTWGNSQLLRRVLWISAELTIVSSLKHKNTQPLYIFNRVRVLHLDRLKEGTWLHSFGFLWLKLHSSQENHYTWIFGICCTKVWSCIS